MRIAMIAMLCILPLVTSAGSRKYPVKSDKPWPMPIVVDVKADPIRDLRESTCGPCIGYAGSLLEKNFDDNTTEWLFEKNRSATAKVFREAGARFVRKQDFNPFWQEGIEYAKLKTKEDKAAMLKLHPGAPIADPHVYFSFWKENGIKAMLCLTSHYVFTDPVRSNKTTSDTEAVKKVICDLVKWILDNGYKDTVAGFEMDNEPFFGEDPEGYGRKWTEIIPAILKIWPEAKLGLPVAEYRAKDPDIAAVRARSTKVDQWFGKGEYFGFQKVNQWSGRAIVALSNQLQNVSHLIYHFYGANAAFACTPVGFARIEQFAKVFPEVKDKRIWITEFRERSDEDLRCHETFFSALWKGHYLLEVLCQPNIDAAMLHHLGAQGGGISTAANGRWWIVMQTDGRSELPDPDYDGHTRLEVGPTGPVFAIYCDALEGHPIVQSHGTANDGTAATYWHASMYYDYSKKYIQALAAGVPEDKLPYVAGRTVEWIATLSPKRDSLSILMVNTKDFEVEMPVEIKGRSFNGKPKVRSVGIDQRCLHWHLLPGEKPLWTVSERTDAKSFGNKMSFLVGPNTVQSVTVPLR